MDKLRAYLIKPEYTIVRFVKNINSPLIDGNGGDINFSWFRKNYSGACLFSKMEMGKNCWVRVWFYHNDLRNEFTKKATRDEYAYWVDPNWLVEIPV